MSEYSRTSTTNVADSSPSGPIIKGITGFNPPPRTKSKKDIYNSRGGGGGYGYQQRERKWSNGSVSSTGSAKASSSYYSSVGTVIAGGPGSGTEDLMSDYDPNLPPVCKFFRKGTCKAGMACRFRHTQEAAAEAARLRASLPHDFEDSFNSGRYDCTPVPSSYSDGDSSNKPINMTSKRPYCAHKASAIMRAKTAQDSEKRSWADITEGPFFGLDVECVAIGSGHSHRHRKPARVAVVDGKGEQLLDEIIRIDSEETNIVSYLTPLTGLTSTICSDPNNKTFEQILELIKETIPANAIIVGHSVQNDIDWLGLEKGTHFKDSIDIAEIFRQRVPRFLTLAANVIKAELEEMGGAADSNGETSQTLVSTIGETEENDPFAAVEASSRVKPDDSSVGFTTRYRVFSLRHCCINLLDVDMQQSMHDPVVDAKYAVLLYDKYHQFSVPKLRTVRDILHRAPVTSSFASQFPVVDAVCLSRSGYRQKRAARFIWKWWKANKVPSRIH